MKIKQTSDLKKQGSAACFRTIKRKRKTATSAFNPISLLSRSSDTETPQAKLKVSAAGDKSEQEADTMAEGVVQNSPSSPVQEFNNGHTQTFIQQAEEEEAQSSVQRAEEEEAQTSVLRAEEEEAQAHSIISSRGPPRAPPQGIQKSNEEESAQVNANRSAIKRKESVGAFGSDRVEVVLAESKLSGRQIEPFTRAYMEERMSADFSAVRIHTDDRAAWMCQRLNARAFAHGGHVYFNTGEYDTKSRGGKWLIAHELTHTIQQGVAQQQPQRASQAAQPAANGSYQSQHGEGGNSSKQNANIQPFPQTHHSRSQNQSDSKQTKNPELEPSEVTNELEETQVDGKIFLASNRLHGDTVVNRPHLSRRIDKELQPHIFSTVPITGTYTAQRFRVSRSTDINQDERESATGLRGPPIRQDSLVVNRADKLQNHTDTARGPPTVSLQNSSSVSAPSFSSVQASPGSIQRIPFGDDINEYANDVPGWRLLTVIIGYNPLTERNVDRTAKNFLAGIMGLMPGGSRLYDKLEDEGVIDDAFTWLKGKQEDIGLTYNGLKEMCEEAWDEIRLIEGFNYNFNIVKRKVTKLIDMITEFGASLIDKVVDLLREKMGIPLVEWVKKKTRAYPLLTVILEQDPVTGAHVERTIPAIIKGFLMLTEQGKSYWKKLEESKKLTEAITWLEGTIAKYDITPTRIVTAFTDLWEALSWKDILNPTGTFEKIYNAFAQPVIDIVSFTLEVALKILCLVKDYFLGVLRKHADAIPGYPLFTVILGKCPLTGQVVPRTPKNFIKGFMSFVPGGMEKYKNLEKSGAVDKAFAWLEKEIAKLDLSWEGIKNLFIQAWDLLTIENFLNPVETFGKLMDIFAGPVTRIITFAVNVGLKVLEFMFIGVMGPTGGRIVAILSKAKSTFLTIIKDPIGFLGNLLKALGKGFLQFSSNILKHLLKGLFGWLFGALAGAGLKLPDKFDLKGILSLVLQVLGLTWERIRIKLVKKLGEPKVKALEKTFEFVKILVTEGVAGVWKKFMEYVEGLKEKVIEGIRDWVITKIVTIAIQKLVTMSNPVGAVIESILLIYNTVMFFIERLNQILDLVEAIVNSIAKIAAGQLAAAANFVEEAMSRTVPVIISFLARLIGLGGISATIKKIIGKIQGVVDKGVDKLINWIEKQVKNVLGSKEGATEKEKEQDLQRAGQAAIDVHAEFDDAGGEHHNLFFREEGSGIELHMASDTPKQARIRINEKLANENTGDVERAACQQALSLLDALKPWTQSHANILNNSEHAEYTASNAQLVTKLDAIKVQIKLAKVDVDDVPVATLPTYSGSYAGFGVSMTVDVLTFNRTYTGSSPTSSLSNDTWRKLNLRRSGEGSYYVKGHLLNDNLGGPGNTWNNLTALSRSGNGQHHSIAEERIKEEVNNNKKVVRYSVTAVYGGGHASKSAALLGSAKLQSDPQKEVKTKIIIAEANVPESLTISAEFLNPLTLESEGAVPGVGAFVPNAVKMDSVDDYQLDNVPQVVAARVDDFAAMVENGVSANTAGRIVTGVRERINHENRTARTVAQVKAAAPTVAGKIQEHFEAGLIKMQVSNPLSLAEINAARVDKGLAPFLPKLHVSTTDPYERQADHVADAVVGHKRVITLGNSPARTVIPVQPKLEPRGPPRASPISTTLEASGSGESMAEPVQTEMGGRMGADFSNVRVHTDSNATQMSSAMGARAFTHGNNIYFNQGEYNPSSSGGKHLLAHELTHTIQQGASQPAIQKKEATSPSIQFSSIATLQGEEATEATTSIPVAKPIAISFAAVDDPAKGKSDVKEKGDDAQRAKGKPLPAAKAIAIVPPTAAPDKETTAKTKDGGEAAASEKENTVDTGGKGEGKESATTDSSDEAFLALTSSTATSIARQYPDFGKVIENKLASDAQKTETETPVLVAENTGETAVNEKAEQQVLAGEEAKLTEGISETGKTKVELKQHKNKAPPPDPTQNDGLLDQQKLSVFISWFRSRFGGFLSGIATHDNGVNTSAGKRPKVKLNGKADPSRSKKNRTEGDEQATTKNDATKTLIRNNDGEARVQPVAVREENKILITAAKRKVETKKQDDMQNYLGMDLPENVRQGADSSMAPMFDKSLASERAKVKQGATKRDTDKKAEVQTAKDKTAALNKQAKTEQDAEIKSRRVEISNEKKRGRKEADKLNDKYKTQADKEQSKTQKDIDKKVQEKEDEADQYLKDGEKEAEDKKNEEEDKAAAKKEELENAQEEKSWWDRACDAVKSAVKAITNAIKAIFNALRKAIAAIINAVKDLALAAIEAARQLVVDLLDAFGEFMKTLVNTFLKELFPELAEKICTYIDTKVDQAKKAVNDFADNLKKGVEALANALTKVLNKILSVFETLLTAAVGIAGALLTGDFAESFRIAIESACSIAGIDSKPIFAFFEKAGSLIAKILRSPVAFIKNVAAAGRKGINLFKTNIVKHLVTGVIDWLTGAMSDVPITLPKKFDLKGIFSIVMQVLGLTYNRLRAKLIKEMGPGSEKVIGTIEKGVSFLMEVKNDFPMALWKKMKEKWQDIKKEAKSKIQETIITEVVKAGIVYLLSMLNPVSAIVKAIIMLYKLIMFIIENKDKIVAFLNSLYNSISQIVNGAIDPAAKSVEKTLARTIPLILGLLSRILGLDGIGKSIQKTLTVIYSKVDKIINPIIKWVAKEGRKLLAKGKGLVKAGKQKVKNLFTWWKHRENFKAKDGSSHKLFFDGKETSARLFVASKKTLYIDFLENLKVDSADTKKTAALAKAKMLAGKIDTERGKTVRGNTDAEKKINQQKKATAIQVLMGQLRECTVLVMGSLEQSENPVYNPSSPNNNKFAKGTIAKKLTKLAPKSGAGSTPSMVKHSIYDFIDKRRQGEKGASYYIRGHLLNHNLYGKGEWHNMTPLTREANSNHEKQVESKVKAAVDAGDRIKYIITPNYSGQTNDVALIKEIKAKDVGVAQKIKIDIVKAEKNVPKSMTCTATSLNKSSSFSMTYTVDNTIGRSYSDYQLGPVPKPDPVSLSKATLADLTSHNRMTTVEANAVIAVRKKDKKNFASFAELYILLNNAIIKAKVEKLKTENLINLF